MVVRCLLGSGSIGQELVDLGDMRADQQAVCRVRRLYSYPDHRGWARECHHRSRQAAFPSDRCRVVCDSPSHGVQEASEYVRLGVFESDPPDSRSSPSYGDSQGLGAIERSAPCDESRHKSRSRNTNDA